MPEDYEKELAQCRQDARVLRKMLAQARLENPSRVFNSRRVELLEGMLSDVETDARCYERLLERSR